MNVDFGSIFDKERFLGIYILNFFLKYGDLVIFSFMMNVLVMLRYLWIKKNFINFYLFCCIKK